MFYFDNIDGIPKGIVFINEKGDMLLEGTAMNPTRRMKNTDADCYNE